MSESGQSEENVDVEENSIKSEVSKSENVRFYLGRKSLPSLPNSLLDKTGSNDSVVPLLLNAEQYYKEYIATSNPVGIKHNVRFLINLGQSWLLGSNQDQKKVVRHKMR